MLIENSWQHTPDDDDDLSLLIMRTRRAIYKEKERAYAKLDISPEQHGVLSHLMQHEKATIGDITERMLREPHTILGLVTRMEARGLITKTKDMNNKGLITITLTDPGRRLCKDLELVDKKFKPTAVLTDLERDQLAHSLEKVLIGCLSRLGKYPEL
ncbi:MarR family winged helix-turn-helix transcriptional regulator [Dehalogenimonas etheniformans]|uniref:MarR family transcriptional regulator n=1 Tax=Dehalogenimonas etheniformans TaxID=1536648 RepID=A0A2P5PA08_9CHLR|nr:MarR family transcriptional regulator [Dehalogenimonas etheniformans]PPD59139.1 MarR family transcriptional regulator [Dehalogenimonas etheniformans]QNT75817.1 MarR family transcriptional regulator [Dehalogenimonas etheniformans]